MGAFLVNFHVRNNSLEQISAALRQIPIDDGWIAGPQEDWITFWDRQASEQNSDRIQHIAEQVSQSLEALVIAFLVHDSDVLCYWLYDLGQQLDEYNSCPGYWGDDAIDEKALAADGNHFNNCQSNALGSEPLQQLSKVPHASRNSVETMQDDAMHVSLVNVCQQSLKCRALQGLARFTVVVIQLAIPDPTL